jgi:hypothetical protein
MVYKIRLNSADAKYGLRSAGADYSQEAMDAWRAAVASTMEAIWKSLPTEMQDSIREIRATLPQKRADACCTRCGGSGYREDKQNWIDLMDGKRCFKCNGSGIETHMEPIFFRRRVVDTLLESTPAKAKEWADKVYNDKEHAYRSVLMDIVDLIRSGASKEEVRKLPH